MVYGLVENWAKVPAAGLFHGVLEVGRIDQAARIARSIEGDAAPEGLFSEFGAQTIQKQGAFDVRKRTEGLVCVLPFLPMERAVRARTGPLGNRPAGY